LASSPFFLKEELRIDDSGKGDKKGLIFILFQRLGMGFDKRYDTFRPNVRGKSTCL